MNARKSILELHFSKNLQYKNTTILIFCTYFIAILIPFLIGQLKFQNFRDILLVAIISSIVVSFIILFLKRFNFHLKNILKELKKLNQK